MKQMFHQFIHSFKEGPKDKFISEDRKNRQDLIGKIIIYAVVIFTLVIFASLVGFVVYQSVLAFHNVGFFNMLFGNKWAPSATPQSFGVLPFIIATFWICLFSMILAIPLGVLSSLFISEILPVRIKKISLTFIELLAGIPSVVFGAFGLMIIGPIFVKMGAPTKENMMTASFILALMSLPTIISLSVHALNGVSQNNRQAAYALGITKTRTTFKVIFKAALPKIIGAVIFGFGRVIGETMAVIMIAGGSVLSPDTANGPLGFFFSSVTTLAGIIGIEINETTSSMHTSALYAVGVILFIIVTLINIIVLLIYRNNERKVKRTRHFRKNNLKVAQLNEEEITNLIFDKATNKSIFSKAYETFAFGFMAMAWFVTMGMVLWVVGDIILEGIFNLHPTGNESIWNFHITQFFTINQDPITGQGGYISLIATTFLLIFTTVSLAMPIGIVVAIYLHEYSRDNKTAKGIRFILNNLTSTPSIVYGLFGLLLFIDFLHIGFSILAAGLTLVVVVLPVIIKSIEDSLKAIPNEYREGSLALGASKINTIIKVILPNVITGITTSMILTMGRIIGESAPVYLTLGATLQLPDKGFMSSGQTLTTHILLLNNNSPLPNKINLMYETAFITISLIFLLNFLAKHFAKNQSQMSGVKTKCVIDLWKLKRNEKHSSKEQKIISKEKAKLQK